MTDDHEIEEAKRRKAELLERLLAIRDEDPGLFDAVVHFELPKVAEAEREQSYREYVARLTAPPEEPLRVSRNAKPGRPRKRYRPVIEHAWLIASFVAWRDEQSVKHVCDRIASSGMHLQIHDTEDGTWNGIDEPEPPLLLIRVEGKKGCADGENVRQTVYAFNDFPEEQKASARYALDQMKRTYRGQPSIYDRAGLECIYPL